VNEKNSYTGDRVSFLLRPVLVTDGRTPPCSRDTKYVTQGNCPDQINTLLKTINETLEIYI